MILGHALIELLNTHVRIEIAIDRSLLGTLLQEDRVDISVSWGILLCAIGPKLGTLVLLLPQV